MTKYVLEGVLGSKVSKNGSRIGQGRRKGAPRGPKVAPRRRKGVPRWSQEGQGGLNLGPWGANLGPKGDLEVLFEVK
jgi:hypothetical protein